MGVMSHVLRYLKSGAGSSYGVPRRPSLRLNSADGHAWPPNASSSVGPLLLHLLSMFHGCALHWGGHGTDPTEQGEAAFRCNERKVGIPGVKSSVLWEADVGVRLIPGSTAQKANGTGFIGSTGM